MGIRNLDPRRKPEQAGIRNSGPRRKPEQAGDGDGDGEGRSVSDFVKRVSETNLLVATLIATVSFTAAFTVPGGYNQSGNVGEGLAVLRKNTAFCVFLIANTLAFGLSTTSIFVHFLASSAITGNVFLREVVQHSISYTNWSVGALLVAFISGTYAVMIKSKRNIEKCLQLELRIWSDIDMHSNIVVFIRVLTSLASAFPTASTHTRHVSTNVKEEIELNASNCVPHQCSHKEE
nr:hypothetical protein CFP56_74343 [Quercus suber]